MTRYAGVKSLDAEITLNLLDGNIVLDYTHNSNGNPFESNRSATIYSEWKDASFPTRFIYVLWWEITHFVMIFGLIFYMPIMTWLGSRQMLSPETQYKHQKFLKWYYIQSEGIHVQRIAGKYDRKTILFHIDANVWLEYKLCGDYKDKVQKISLKRNFQLFKRFGVFNELRQNGWNVIFEFSEPPQHGSCKIFHI